MLVLEIEKPHKGWWIKGLKRQIWIVTPFILFTCLMLNLEGESAYFIMLFELKLIPLILYYCLVLSHYYEYPYKVTLFQDYFIVEYLWLRRKIKRKYRYKNIEIMTQTHKNERHTSICHKILLGYNLFLSEPDGWPQEKQDVFIDAMKSKGVLVTRL